MTLTLLTLFSSLIVSYLLCSNLFNPIYFQEILGGWFLAALFGIAGILIHKKAVGKNLPQFFVLGLGLNFFKAAFFLLFTIGAIHLTSIKNEPFVISAMTTYLGILLLDIINLARISRVVPAEST